jgi:serine/threonine protein kinase
VATVKNEIMILRKVNNCARIIKLLEVYESEHSIYLVQELMEGDHLLKRFMQKSGRPKLLSALTLKIMENLLKAVQ